MRGEHRLQCLEEASGQGSPPHARGTPNITYEQVLDKRITPACAGNTKVIWMKLKSS